LTSHSEQRIGEQLAPNEARREAALREVLKVISRSRDDEKPVFDVILENAARLCGAPMASLSIANDARTHVTMMAHWGTPLRHYQPGVSRFALDGRKLVARAISEIRTFHQPDLADDDLYREGHPERQALVDIEGVRTFLVVPLVSGDMAIGTIALYRRTVSPFSKDQIALVETFAEQAVIAIENARQFRALRDRTEEVRAQAEELRELNKELESRVARQVGELERMGRLKHFLSPQVAEAVISSGDDRLLSSHRALIAVLFCDIRGFTAFCEQAEPEEAIEVLQAYHEAMGELIRSHAAGVDHRTGDGIMIIFNDPLPCDDPADKALELALAMRERMIGLCAGWRRLGYRLGHGIGLSLGYATVGMVGSAGRYDYTASGTVVNLAARLCEEAGDGEILLSPRACAAVEDRAAVEPAGELTLKGFSVPVKVMRLIHSNAAH
jgi:class 3 adenylate cyclase